MQPARRRSDLLGHRRREGNHVVLGRLLDLLDAGDVEVAALTNVARGLARDDAGVGHRLRRRGLDLQPRLVAAFVAPDSAHVRVGIAWDHDNSPPRRTRGTQRNKPRGTFVREAGANRV